MRKTREAGSSIEMMYRRDGLLGGMGSGESSSDRHEHFGCIVGKHPKTRWNFMIGIVPRSLELTAKCGRSLIFLQLSHHKSTTWISFSVIHHSNTPVSKSSGLMNATTRKLRSIDHGCNKKLKEFFSTY